MSAALWLSGSLALAAGPLPGTTGGSDASGQVLLSRDVFTVQTKETFEWIYVVGAGGFSLGDTLEIHDPVFHGMRWSKWGDLLTWDDVLRTSSTCEAQTDDGAQASFGMISAYAARDGQRLEDVPVTVERSNCGPALCTKAIHESHSSLLYLESGALQPGDTLHVVHGDVEGCHAACDGVEKDCSSCDLCGFEAPDRSFPSVWWEATECLGTAPCTSLDPVSFSVQAQPDVYALLVTAPSQVLAGDAFDLKVAVLDAYGNPIADVGRNLTVLLEDLSGEVLSEHPFTLPADTEGWHDFSVRLDDPGIARLKVYGGTDAQGVSNPIEVLEEAPEYRIYWGDIHVHHGYTWLQDGQRRDFNHDYGRDVVGLDIVSESMKAEGIEIDGQALWTELKDNCVQYSVSDEYLVLLGFEWIGDDAAEANCGSAATCSEGHHNIYYDGCEGTLATQDVSVIDSLSGERGLWTWLDGVRQSSGVDAVSIPHAMRWTYFNFDLHYSTPDEPGYPGTQTLVEVYSEWGDGTGDATAAGSVQEMMRRGHRLGWIGGSDNHDGWMGNPYAQNNTTGGMGAFLAPALTRADIFEAMTLRRTYATTGHRPILHFSISDGDATLQQGAELLAREPTLRWQYYATAPIQNVHLYRLWIHEATTSTPTALYEGGADTFDNAGVLPLLSEDGWDGALDALYWIEVIQKDREKAWSSPIWVTTDCSRRTLGALDPNRLCDDTPHDSADSGPGPADDTAPPQDSAATDSSPSQTRVRCDGCATSRPMALSPLLAALLLSVYRRRSRRLL